MSTEDKNTFHMVVAAHDEDGEPQEVEIRMTVRVPQGAKAAIFTLQIHDAERLQREAFAKVVDRVKLDTKVSVFHGIPE